MTEITKLENELELFWKWSKMDISDCETKSVDGTLYLRWNELLDLALEAIRLVENGEKNERLLEKILEIMALDNENEEILDHCETELNTPNLEHLISVGVSYSLPDTRWQIAELIGRKKNIEWKKYLLTLINDKNKYVQRRALLSLAKIHPDKAAEISYQKLRDEDEMLRVVSLRILEETSSILLSNAIQILKDDLSKQVLEELRRVKRNIEI